jgi:hypothetical protein
VDFLPWEKELFHGRDPVVLWGQVSDALGLDPDPLLEACEDGDEEALDFLKAKLSEVPLTEAEYLEFMAWVQALRTEYKLWSDLNILPSTTLTYRDLCGLWFNRDQNRYRNLWTTYRALYLIKWGLPLPAECYQSVCSTEAEAQELQYDEVTDAIDRDHTAKH